VSKHRRPQPRRLRRTGLVLGLSAAVVVVGATSAAAYWKASGSGSGTAKTGTGAAISFTTTGTVPLLYPTGTFDLALTVTRNATKTITIQTLTPGTVVSASPSTCPASWVTVATKTGLSLAVANGSGTANVTVPAVVSMGAAAPTACQGVSFTIPITLTGAQS
jgi:hypothetical protein